MPLENWLIYLAAVTLLSLTPGPNGLLALSHGARYGARQSCSTILGGTVGFILLMLASLLGLGGLLLASETAFLMLKLLGAGYLVYLGVRQWRADPEPMPGSKPGVMEGAMEEADRQVVSSSHRRRATEGFSVAISNPKVILFFMAFLPQFIDPQQPLMIQFMILATTFAVVEFAVELLLAMSAARVLGWFAHRRGMQLFNRLTGGMFIGAGALLVISQR